jgi:ribosome maturation factor RimP
MLLLLRKSGPGCGPPPVAFFIATGALEAACKMYTDLLQLEDELDRMVYDFGYQLADLQVMGSARGRIFRVFVDRVDGVDVGIDELAALSPQVEMFLTMKRVYDDNCHLEMSSAGLDRVLKRDRDLERYLGSEVRVTVFEDGQRRTMTGELSSFNDEVLVVAPTGQKGELPTLHLERRHIERVSLVPHVEMGKK